MEHQKETLHQNHAGHEMNHKQQDDHSTMKHDCHDMSGMRHDGNPSMGHEGHNHHAMMVSDFKKRFYVVLVFTIPILMLSPVIQQFIGVNWQFTGSSYILFGLLTIAINASRLS